MPTALAVKLARRIAREGAIGVDDYMTAALADPEHGYYMGRDPLGPRGDFVTAPEISQMFGELIGLWCAETWQSLGRPDGVLLAELGPGRGTLMADALRAARVAPDFAAALELHLVEVSPALRALQATKLAAAAPVWHADIGSLPEAPLLVIANEFFDALPVCQFVKRAGTWCERRIGLAGGASPEAPAFAFVAGPPAEAHLIPEFLGDAPNGAVFEVSPAARVAAAEIGRRIARHGGAALIFDYGHGESATGETLQAVRHHARHDPLAAPGAADLTCHVDFAAFAESVCAAGAEAHGPVDQGVFLRRLGIDTRAAHLRQRASPAQARDLDAALARLTAPAQMGRLFKALALVPRGFGPPAGFG